MHCLPELLVIHLTAWNHIVDVNINASRPFDSTSASLRALQINETGRLSFAAPVSIDLASLVLETKDSVRHAARQLQVKAKATFKSSVRAVSSITCFAVNGLPDPELQLSDTFALTLRRAVTSIAVCVAKGDAVRSIACRSGLRWPASEGTRCNNHTHRPSSALHIHHNRK
jgi:hypothetical protein